MEYVAVKTENEFGAEWRQIGGLNPEEPPIVEPRYVLKL